MYPVLNLGFTQIPTFFIVMSILMALTFFMTIQRSEKLKINGRLALDVVFVLAISGVIGARLSHVIFENLDYYMQNPIKILFFWEGGFVFYGGFIISFFSGLMFLKFQDKLIYLNLLMRLFTPILSLVYTLGRFGCFLEGCCYGKFCQLAWAVNGRHPTQLYSAIWELGTFLFLMGYESRDDNDLRKNPERLFYLWLGLHSMGRFITEIFRDDFRGPVWVFPISAWISMILMLISAIYFYRHRKLVLS